MPARAIAYYRRGAELALRVFANHEAAEALTRAVDLLRQMPKSRRRDEEELELTVMLGAARGWGTPDYSTARDLSLKLGRAVSPPILRGMAMNSIMRLELPDAREAGSPCSPPGSATTIQSSSSRANTSSASPRSGKARFRESRRHLEAAVDRYSPTHRETHLTLYGQDPKVVCLSRLAWTLWFLGHPDEAASARDAAVSLADESVTHSVAAMQASTAPSSARSSTTSRAEHDCSRRPRRSRQGAVRGVGVVGRGASALVRRPPRGPTGAQRR